MENKEKLIFKGIIHCHIFYLSYSLIRKYDNNVPIFKKFIDQKEAILFNKFTERNKNASKNLEIKNVRNVIIFMFSFMLLRLVKNIVDTFTVDVIFKYDRIINGNNVQFVKNYTIIDHIFDNKFIPKFLQFNSSINNETEYNKEKDSINFNNLQSYNEKFNHKKEEISLFKNYKI